MGEQDVQLIEKNVANNTEDIRELKKQMEKVQGDVVELKSTSKLMQQSQTHIMENMSELKTSIKALGDKWEEKWDKEDKRRDAEREDELKRYQNEKDDRAKEMRAFGWKVFAGIIIAGVSLILTLI